MDLNKVMLIGNVVRDPEMRTTPTGQQVASFAIATNLVWTDKNGQKQKKAEFHNIVAWRKLAEIIGQYVKKGSKVYMEGRLETRSWDDQNAVKHYRTEIVADNLILLDRAGSAPQGNTDMSQPTYAPVEQAPVPTNDIGSQEISVDDIPF
jgi:single-strand DNA-binding protein